MKKKYVRVLTIAGSDSGGGAGIQADLKTFSAIGCYGMSVITALTAQNTTGVTAIHAVPAHFVQEQIEAVITDMGVDAVKIGMLFSAQLIRSVSEELLRHQIKRIVLDPVMVAQSGDKLLQDDAIEAIKAHLMPLAEVVTPNIPEAEVMLNQSLSKPATIRDGAAALARYGSRSVLIKGGHLSKGNSSDILYLREEDRFVELTAERIQTRNNHGTGCTLSSAIAAYRAKGNSIESAVKKAKSYISRAIEAGKAYKSGHGSGPVQHFFNFWQ